MNRQGTAARKRSAGVRLTRMTAALGVLAGGAAMVTGCGPAAPTADAAPRPAGEEVKVYESAFDCARDSGLSQEQCLEGRKVALANSEKIAPRFESQDDCYAEYGTGQCVEHKSGGRRVFMPFMTGYLVGKFAGGNGARDFTPLYRRAGETGYTTASGHRLSYGGAPGKYYAVARALETPKTVPRVKSSSGVVSEGGLTRRSSGLVLGGGDSDSDGRAHRFASADGHRSGSGG